MARLAAELRGFDAWKPLHQSRMAAVHDLQPYQNELVYEATATVYEHGFAFVEAPPGAGKTAIGRHLAITLARTHAAAFDLAPREPGRSQRASTVIVAPPAVRTSWMEQMPPHIEFVPTTRLSSTQRHPGNEIDGLLAEAAALIVDEAHNFATRWRHESARARQFETVPAVWTACLSATLAGNHGTDTILTMHERRAALNMTPDFVGRMNELLADGWSLETADSPIAPERNTAQIADALAQFVCRRSRHCVGEKPPGTTFGSPAFGYARAPATPGGHRPNGPLRQEKARDP